MKEYIESNTLIATTYPSNWKLLRNKSFLSLTNEKVGDRSDEYNLLSLTTNGVVIRDVESGKGKFPKDFDSYQVVYPNELVFCLFDIDETPRTIGLVNNIGMITGAYSAFKVDSSRAIPEYIYYYYLAVDNIKALKPYYSGLRKTVRPERFLRLYIPLPPISEQEGIVAYIKSKTQNIDAYVAERERVTAA